MRFRAAIKRFFTSIYYFFPVQLLLVSLKRHQLLLAFWLMLFSIVVGKFGISYGIPYLFFDPEYLDHTGYLAFTLVGMGFGAFYVAWNLNCYMLHSYRFTFMARFQRPMGVYFLNNSLLPFIFLASYFLAIVRFQTESQSYSPAKIAFSIIGFIIGFVIVLLITAVYFTFTNRTALHAEEERKKKNSKLKWLTPISDESHHAHPTDRHADTYIAYNLRIRTVSSLEHYHPETLKLVYRQHHSNALFAQVITLLFILSIGFFMDHTFFQIPSAASVFMFLSIVMSLFGVLMYWAGGWATTTILLFFVVVNELYKVDVLGYQSHAYGISYDKKAKYNIDTFREISSNKNIRHDLAHFATILENWRKKNMRGLAAGKKPKLVFINVSGGGLRAAGFATIVMQHADSLLGGKLFEKTFMISGASGGMFGASYLRELYLQKRHGAMITLSDRKYYNNITKDLLNPVLVSVVSNDLLLPFHKFSMDGSAYFKDRGYMMERKLSANTDSVLEKRIKDYYQDEYLAHIPVMVMHTEITNDARRFFICPQPLSFMMRPVGKYTTNRNLDVDAIDFLPFFKEQHGENLTLLSALRMNATFPMILPNSAMPTEPEVYILDGGALDDVGHEPTFRMLGAFKDWINENTDGVVIIQIRDGARHEYDDLSQEKKDLFTMVTNPLGTIFSNQMSNEDFVIDQKLGYANEALLGKVQMIAFEYTADEMSQKAALSFHLTQREKDNIVYALKRPNNAEGFRLLLESLK
ncbi:MAG: hypothetical protein JWO03_800 [Bacteroidetes bacterium]|nr:hypothetical protein [Bacteroidota bacterium]